MLRFHVRIGRVAARDRVKLADGFFEAFGKRIEFLPLATQPGFLAVVLPETRGRDWNRRYDAAIKLFNALSARGHRGTDRAGGTGAADGSAGGAPGVER